MRQRAVCRTQRWNDLECGVDAHGEIADSIVFDTHAFVKELTDAGMPEPQAEVPARTHAKSIDEKLAAKRDFAELERRLKHARTLRLGSMMVVTVGVVAALAKLLQYGSPATLGGPPPHFSGSNCRPRRCVVHVGTRSTSRRRNRGGALPGIAKEARA